MTRLADSRLAATLGLINTKDLASYFGFSKPKLSQAAAELSDEEVEHSH